jgi:dephospho-CoA kinase
VKLIGLTGGVGSGKSTVAEILRELGAVVVDADEASHAVYEPGTPGFQAVAGAFGDFYVHDGRIDRQRLGELVFKDAASRRRLNAIVHPLVREWMAARTAEAVEQGAVVVVQDVPLLFENGLERLFSSVVLVYVPEAVQLERLIAPTTAAFQGRGFTPERARAVIATQVPIEEKRRRAQHVIDNSGSLDQTRKQVEELWARLVSD